ncbi:putative nuclease HARBI1 [Cucumis melo var. makuwa]|uniref:Nuclease HARBI1 n=1 Tax=Cucumis melo var. makuwa TaxID=1194695 RepID=A0A5A7TND0_CUCMM|nr:putative nuclease HARBI1 [Cucumis melo var. makuwa]TYK05315.1 putative nuclease HARBI1 [Cucumis melo var. makuwa]
MIDLESTEVSDVEEMVVIFLHVLAHDMKNRQIQREFIQSDVRWQSFENCLGALNGTYIKVNVSKVDRPRYRTRKSEVAMNVLDVCDTKRDFVFVLVGWDGSIAARGRWTILRGKSYYPVQVKCRTIMACCLLHNLMNRKMTNADILEDEDEGNSTYATTSGDDINYIEAIVEIRGPACSDFGWNDDMKCIIAERDVFGNWIRTHPAAKRLLNKPFPHYDELLYVFDKYHATEDDMMTERSSRSIDCKSGSSGQKRKHTCRHSRLITSFGTPWKVRMINLGPLQNDQIKLARKKTLCCRRSILSLSVEGLSKCVMIVMEKVLLMKSFIKMPDLMKATYYRVLRDNP